MTFGNKTIFVTGAGSGIGRALSVEIGKRGGYVVCTDVNAATAEETAKAIGSNAESHALDVVDADAFNALATSVRERRGAIDVLVNNAGIGIGGDIVDYEEGDWKRVLDINIWGVVHGINAVYPAMIEKKSGHIVNMASIAGLLPAPGLVSYAASKHAVVGMSLSLRIEAELFGVDVSVICPGVITTPILKSTVRGVAPDKRGKLMKVAMPMKQTDPVTAGVDIANGIEQNLPIIFTPKWVQRYHRAWRFLPSMVWKQLRETGRRLRRLKDE